MLTKSTVQLMALGLVGSFAATAAAQDAGALIDLMVRKGMLKDQEAEQVRAQLSRDYAANTPAGKLNLSSSVKELKLSGDVRARYTNQNDTAQAFPYGQTRDSRFRLRLRVNSDYKLSDDVTAGFGLQTQSKSDSGNVTMAKDTANGNGYYENYAVFISKAYLGWTPVSGVTLTGGKFANPLYTTDMLWDADINPAGFAERIDFHKFLNLGGLELSLNAVQGSVSDNTESVNRDVYGTRKSTDGWVFQTQLIASAEVAEGVKVTIAPGFYCTNGGTVNSAAQGGGEANALQRETALRGLKVALLPGDVSFKMLGKPAKVVWDAAYNQDASDRMGAYVGPNTATGGESSNPFAPTGTDKLAWLAGVQLGENKKKGDWSVLANWRQVGAASVDSSINDSDWALSRTNMAGPKVAFVYNFGDAFTLGAAFYSATNIRREVTTAPADKNSVRVLQIDGVVKF